MPRLIRTLETDVCVVGAGLIGLAHALEAQRRGLSVIVLERGSRATGASIRNTGHLFFSALPDGAPLDAAAQGRERWIELARSAGVPATAGGTLMVARHQDELALMEAAASDPQRKARLRSAKKVGNLVQIPVDGVLGAFHAKHDLRIDPRSTPAALARLLARDASARLEWDTHVHQIEPGVVHAGTIRIRAGAILVCPGADHRALPAELRPPDSGLALRQTQMLRLSAPGARRYRQTLTTGLSLLEYPAFHRDNSIEQLRARLEIETPELIERGVSVNIAQLSDGDLIVGSTVSYMKVPKPFSRDRLDVLLLEQVRTLLGFEPVIRQRWHSTQVCVPGRGDDFLVTRPMPTVRVVQAIGPTAMAACHAHAGAVLEELLAGPERTDMYITVRDMRKSGTGAGGLRDHARAFSARGAADS